MVAEHYREILDEEHRIISNIHEHGIQFVRWPL